MKRKILFLIVIIGLLSGTTKAYCADVSVNVSVDTMVDLELDSPTYSFGSVSSTELDQGFVEEISASTITIKSNTGWNLTIKTTNANMGISGGYTKPISDFEWRKSGGAYQAITQTETTTDTGSPSSSEQIAIDYKILMNWTVDEPGTYSITLVYKLTSS